MLVENGVEGSWGRSGQEVEAHINDHGQRHRHHHEGWHCQRPILARVIGDAEGAEVRLGRVGPDEVDGGGGDGGDGSDEAVHLRRLGAGSEGGGGGGGGRP